MGGARCPLCPPWLRPCITFSCTAPSNPHHHSRCFLASRKAADIDLVIPVIQMMLLLSLVSLYFSPKSQYHGQVVRHGLLLSIPAIPGRHMVNAASIAIAFTNTRMQQWRWMSPTLRD